MTTPKINWRRVWDALYEKCREHSLDKRISVYEKDFIRKLIEQELKEAGR